MARSKRYRAAAERRDNNRSYPLAEALALVKSSASAKFDETVECHIKLNIRGNQTVRDTTVLPHGFQAEKRILVFARGDKAGRESGGVMWQCTEPAAPLPTRVVPPAASADSIAGDDDG